MSAHQVRRTAAVAAVLALAAAPATRAQRPTPTAPPPRIEIGADGQIQFGATSYDGNGGSENSTSSRVLVPGALRVGFFLSDRVSLEPSAWLDFRSESGANLTQLDADLGLLYHLAPGPTPTRWYLRPFVGMRLISAENDTDTQLAFGIGLGAKVPVSAQFATRVEALYQHANQSDFLPAFDGAALRVGMSLFVR